MIEHGKIVEHAGQIFRLYKGIYQHEGCRNPVSRTVSLELFHPFQDKGALHVVIDHQLLLRDLRVMHLGRKSGL